MRKILGTFITLCILLLSAELSAQSIDPTNLQNVNVNELSTEQIREADREIQSRGLSLSEFEQVAIVQGASRQQVQQLIQRIRQVRAQGTVSEDRIDDTGERRLQTIDEPFREVERPEEIRIFGMDLFDRVSVSFEPSMNIPTPKDYTLGAGDELIIDIWGAAERTYRLTVSAEGTIRISNLSPIYVNGLQIDEAERRILNRLTDIYSGLRPNDPENANTFAEVTLGNVRTIKVTIMGEVRQPGTYTISSLATVFNALYAAGGPNRQGTFREIKIIREKEVIETMDIYDFLVFGNQENNIRLRDQDVIKIDPYMNRVRLRGETKRTGLFELKDGETVDDLLAFASGFSDRAYTRRFTLEGNTPTMRRVQNIFYPEGGNIVLNNGDEITVGEILDRYENRIRIQGAVYRPGTYEYVEGLTLYDLINKADGLREEVFTERGVIERLRENREPEMMAFHVGRLMEDPAQYDIPLRPDDMVRISSIFDLREELNVTVRGAVNDGGTFEFRDGMTLGDAIFRANGYRDEAAPYRVDVARRVTGGEGAVRSQNVAELFRFEVDPQIGFDTESAEFKLMPFDQIYVRVKPDYQVQQTVRIEGEVQFPGTYVIDRRDMRLSDLVEMAGGLSDYAYARGASLERVIEFGVDDEAGLEFLTPQERLERQRDRRSSIGIRLENALQRPGTQHDVLVERGDVLTVPKEMQHVRVEGEVLSPRSIRYDGSRSFSDYIDGAGGITDNAMSRRVYIVYPNGEVDRTKRFLFFTRTPDVEPGSTIIVPQKPERRELTAQERISLASTVVSTLATVALIIDRLN